MREYPVDPDILAELVPDNDQDEAEGSTVALDALEDLPPDERTVIDLLYFGTRYGPTRGPSPRPGWAVAEVARFMGVSKVKVRKLEKRGLRRLRDAVEEATSV